MSPLLFIYVIILFVCLSFYLSYFPKFFNFIIYPMQSSILSSIIYMKFFSSLIKCLHFLFQLNSNYIWMVIILFEFFSKNLQFYTLSYLSSIYHTYIIWKSSVLYKNVSISTFNFILDVLVWLSLYLNFFWKKSSIL